MFKEATNEKIIISVLSATLLLAGCSSHDGQQSKSSLIIVSILQK